MNLVHRYPLMLDRRNTRLRYHNGQLIIQTDRHREQIPLHLISHLIIATPIESSSRLWHILAEAGIPVVFLPTRRNHQPAWLAPGLTASIPLRQRQYHLAADDPARLRLAWYWIEQKLHAQRLALELLQAPPGPLETIRPPHTLTLDTLLGIEGTAARHYFQQLARHLPDNWRFTGRRRNPPPDPFNALLSLSYTLLTTEALRIVHSLGFDPWLGFLHTPHPGRPALALDLIEPFRPQIDLWCLHLAHETLQPEKHFTLPDDEDTPALLNKTGRVLYYQRWSIDRQNWKADKSLPQLLLETAHTFRQHLLDPPDDSPDPPAQ